jgi:phosphoserine phosphatase
MKHLNNHKDTGFSEIIDSMNTVFPQYPKIISFLSERDKRGVCVSSSNNFMKNAIKKNRKIIAKGGQSV